MQSVFVRWGLVALLVAIAACVPPVGAQAQATSGFYVPLPAELRGPAGSLIRYEPMVGAPAGAAAYRILYRSRGLKGEPIAVSGVILVPPGAAPPGGRPIVAWAHPTSGVVPACAPSLARVFYRSVQGLEDMIARGYVVAATDYPGLGTPGIHPYLIGPSEARAVLDSVRAARQLAGPKQTSRVFAVWGHSQGGHAALYTGLMARSYAPDLSLAGVAAAAPATELATLMKADFDTSGGKNLTAITLWAWSRLFDIPLTSVVTPQAMPAVDELAEGCIETIWDVLARRAPSQELRKSFLSVNGIADRQPWHSILARNTPGPLPRGTPVFLAQGTSDDLVLPRVTLDYRARLCRHGSRVELLQMPGTGHAFAGRDAAEPAIAWIADRFAGLPAPSNCR